MTTIVLPVAVIDLNVLTFWWRSFWGTDADKPINSEHSCREYYSRTCNYLHKEWTLVVKVFTFWLTRVTIQLFSNFLNSTSILDQILLKKVLNDLLKCVPSDWGFKTALIIQFKEILMRRKQNWILATYFLFERLINYQWFIMAQN